MKQKFIVIEGLDGSGTTTQISLIADYIYNLNKSNRILMTREPTDSKYGKTARKILKMGCKDNEELLELFINDRLWHIKNVIKPNLEIGNYVICDRYFLSTLAYQSLQGFNIDYIKEKQKDIPLPDITFLLDVDVNNALKRLESSRKTKEIFEGEDFMKRCRLRYLKLRDIYSNIVVIDSNKSIEDVTKDIIEHLS